MKKFNDFDKVNENLDQDTVDRMGGLPQPITIELDEKEVEILLNLLNINLDSIGLSEEEVEILEMVSDKLTRSKLVGMRFLRLHKNNKG